MPCSLCHTRTVPRIVEVIEPSIGLEGYLAIDTLSQGVAFGGLRIDPAVTSASVAELARRMTLKLNVHGGPVGGAKAGLRGSPDDPRLSRWMSVFASRCAAELRHRVVLGKDMGATDEALASLYRSLGSPQLSLMHRRAGQAASITTIRQLRGYRRHMTALGILWSVQTVLGDALQGRRVIIQGFGAVGAGAAVRLRNAGATIVGVSDRNRALSNPAGLPVQELLQARTQRKEIDPRLCSFPHRVLPPNDLLRLEADVLVLAAGSHLIDQRLAQGIVCPLIIEGANVGLLSEAQTELDRRGATVIPDVIANSTSAALVGHQIASANTLSRVEVWRRIHTELTHSIKRTLSHCRETGVAPHRAVAALYASN